MDSSSGSGTSGSSSEGSSSTTPSSGGSSSEQGNETGDNGEKKSLDFVIGFGIGGSLGMAYGVTGSEIWMMDEEWNVAKCISIGGGVTSGAEGIGFQVLITNAKSFDSLTSWGYSIGGTVLPLGVDYTSGENSDGTPWKGYVITVGEKNDLFPLEAHAYKTYT